MSVFASKWAKRQRVRSTCKLVLTTLADFADAKGCCWPAQGRLAAETNLAVRTVRLALAEMSAAGMIVRSHRGNGAGGRTTDLIELVLARDFDLIAAADEARKQPELLATDAGKGGGSYRQIKDGLAANEGHLSGRICRGRNLSGTTKNYRPSREQGVQEGSLGRSRPPAAGGHDVLGDDAFGPPLDLGEDLDGWAERHVDAEFAR